MNILVQTTGVDSYSLNGKIETPNINLDNIIGDVIINSSNKKELL